MSGTEWTEQKGDVMVTHVDSWRPAKSGTEWVEPGQGATVDQIYDKVRSSPLWWEGGATALDTIWPTNDVPGRGWDRRTNLRLTGEPLSAEDVERIGRAK